MGPGVVVLSAHVTVWVSMRGSLWKCTSLHCKLAADGEARGLEIQNALLADLRTELQDNRGRKSCADVSLERPPVSPEEAPPPPATTSTSASSAAAAQPEAEVIQELPTIRENEPFLPEEDVRLRPAPVTPATATPDGNLSGDSTPTSVGSSQIQVAEKTGASIETIAARDSGNGKRVKVSRTRRGKRSTTPSEDSEQSQSKALRNSIELVPSRSTASSSTR